MPVTVTALVRKNIARQSTAAPVRTSTKNAAQVMDAFSYLEQVEVVKVLPTTMEIRVVESVPRLSVVNNAQHQKCHVPHPASAPASFYPVPVHPSSSSVPSFLSFPSILR